jgi:hypothetical protein
MSLPLKYINVGDRKYPCRYDINALCQIEALTGKSFISGVADISITIGRAIVFAGLSCGARFNKEKFKYTIDDIGEWEDFLTGVLPQCVAVLNESLGVTEETKSSDEKADKPGE